MPEATIECPHCKGRVGHARGQSLPDALARHIELSHTINKAAKPKAAEPAESPPETPVRSPQRYVRIPQPARSSRPGRRSGGT